MRLSSSRLPRSLVRSCPAKGATDTLSPPGHYQPELFTERRSARPDGGEPGVVDGIKEAPYVLVSVSDGGAYDAIFDVQALIVGGNELLDR